MNRIQADLTYLFSTQTFHIGVLAFLDLHSSRRCVRVFLAWRHSFECGRVDHQKAPLGKAHLLGSQASECSHQPCKWVDCLLPRMCAHKTSQTGRACLRLHYWQNSAFGEPSCPFHRTTSKRIRCMPSIPLICGFISCQNALGTC